MKKKDYALALSGGGTRGAYEVGAYKALNEIGINIKAIAGTSIGALNGAMFLSANLEKAEDMYNKIDISNVLDVDDIKARLNEFGNYGWEVCGFQVIQKVFGCQAIIIMKKGLN